MFLQSLTDIFALFCFGVVLNTFLKSTANFSHCGIRKVEMEEKMKWTSLLSTYRY